MSLCLSDGQIDTVAYTVARMPRKRNVDSIYMELRLGVDARLLRWRCGWESELMCKLKLESGSLLQD